MKVPVNVSTILHSFRIVVNYYFNVAVCSRQCDHGGNCSSPDKCSCPPGWTGTYCQTGATITVERLVVIFIWTALKILMNVQVLASVTKYAAMALAPIPAPAMLDTG